MSGIWHRFLPEMTASRECDSLLYWTLVVVALIGTGRSIIHIFAPDGGAHSIAGIGIDLAGGANIVAMFAQWGASQLVLALIYWLVILRYPALVPFIWFCVFIEQILRFTVGQLKPLTIATLPPGAYGTYILMAVSLFMLSRCLRTDNNSKAPL